MQQGRYYKCTGEVEQELDKELAKGSSSTPRAVQHQCVRTVHELSADIRLSTYPLVTSMLLLEFFVNDLFVGMLSLEELQVVREYVYERRSWYVVCT